MTDKVLRVHSWHWSWWVADQEIPREAIESIKFKRSKVLGLVWLRIRTHDGRQVKVRARMSPDDVLLDLRERGYQLH